VNVYVCGQGVKLTTHLHLVLRSRMCGAIPPFPNTPSWHGTQLKHRDNFTLPYLTFVFILHIELQLMVFPVLYSRLAFLFCFSLRTLCRALSVAALNKCGSVPRSLYESLCLSFLTQLDYSSHPVVEQMVAK
jgi:hypothetical protein